MEHNVKLEVLTAKVETHIQKVKDHVIKNQTAYVAGGCVLAGLVFRRKVAPTQVNVAPVINNVVAPVINTVVNNTVNLGGTMSKICKCIETGEKWESVTETAEVAGTTLSKMSRHLNDHKDHVNGLHYEIIGIRTTG